MTIAQMNLEQYLDLGLRDQWYPVLASWEVASSPVGITRLGENIVVWLMITLQNHR